MHSRPGSPAPQAAEEHIQAPAVAPHIESLLDGLLQPLPAEAHPALDLGLPAPLVNREAIPAQSEAAQLVFNERLDTLRREIEQIIAPVSNLAGELDGLLAAMQAEVEAIQGNRSISFETKRTLTDEVTERYRGTLLPERLRNRENLLMALQNQICDIWYREYGIQTLVQETFNHTSISPEVYSTMCGRDPDGKSGLTGLFICFDELKKYSHAILETTVFVHGLVDGCPDGAAPELRVIHSECLSSELFFQYLHDSLCSLRFSAASVGKKFDGVEGLNDAEYAAIVNTAPLIQIPFLDIDIRPISVSVFQQIQAVDEPVILNRIGLHIVAELRKVNEERLHILTVPAGNEAEQVAKKLEIMRFNNRTRMLIRQIEKISKTINALAEVSETAWWGDDPATEYLSCARKALGGTATHVEYKNNFMRMSVEDTKEQFARQIYLTMLTEVQDISEFSSSRFGDFDAWRDCISGSMIQQYPQIIPDYVSNIVNTTVDQRDENGQIVSKLKQLQDAIVVQEFREASADADAAIHAQAIRDAQLVPIEINIRDAEDNAFIIAHLCPTLRSPDPIPDEIDAPEINTIDSYKERLDAIKWHVENELLPPLFEFNRRIRVLGGTRMIDGDLVRENNQFDKPNKLMEPYFENRGGNYSAFFQVNANTRQTYGYLFDQFEQEFESVWCGEQGLNKLLQDILSDTVIRADAQQGRATYSEFMKMEVWGLMYALSSAANFLGEINQLMPGAPRVQGRRDRRVLQPLNPQEHLDFLKRKLYFEDLYRKLSDIHDSVNEAEGRDSVSQKYNWNGDAQFYWNMALAGNLSIHLPTVIPARGLADAIVRYGRVEANVDASEMIDSLRHGCEAFVEDNLTHIIQEGARLLYLGNGAGRTKSFNDTQLELFGETKTLVLTIKLFERQLRQFLQVFELIRFDRTIDQATNENLTRFEKRIKQVFAYKDGRFLSAPLYSLGKPRTEYEKERMVEDLIGLKVLLELDALPPLTIEDDPNNYMERDEAPAPGRRVRARRNDRTPEEQERHEERLAKNEISLLIKRYATKGRMHHFMRTGQLLGVDQAAEAEAEPLDDNLLADDVVPVEAVEPTVEPRVEAVLPIQSLVLPLPV
ncbi:MAG: hypothetical protein V4490_03625, partial [Pseudomonadota bacterium]